MRQHSDALERKWNTAVDQTNFFSGREKCGLGTRLSLPSLTLSLVRKEKRWVLTPPPSFQLPTSLQGNTISPSLPHTATSTSHERHRMTSAQNVTTLATDIPSAPSQEGRHPGSMRERSENVHTTQTCTAQHTSPMLSVWQFALCSGPCLLAE